jgi:leucyl aminopeptidase
VVLSEFTGGVPWAHLDIAPTMKVDADESWRSKGPPGSAPVGDEFHEIAT